MVKIKHYFLALLLILSLGFKANSQVYEKGNVILDAYYGGPNLFTSVVRGWYKVAKNFGEENLPKITSRGPYGGKVEILLSERIGLGLNVNYANTIARGSYQYKDSIGNPTGPIYNYKASIPRVRIFPTLNVHMGSSDKLDPYFSFGIGYNGFKIKQETNDPKFVDLSFPLPSNFAARVEFGIRYFISDHIGLHGQIGVGGGPLVAGGLSFKF